MKSDIKLNMSQLTDIQYHIAAHMGQLDELKQACTDFKAVVEAQSSIALGTLSTRLQNDIISDIQEMYNLMNRFWETLSQYIGEMEGYIAPKKEDACRECTQGE